METKTGTYVLLLECRTNASIQIGRWRSILVERGYYLYVGSAFGPGGIRARVARHARRRKKRHWHIDYLRECLSLVDVWVSHDPVTLEHHWAQIMHHMDGMSPVAGFGCSDCNCHAHLFHSRRAPDITLFSSATGNRVTSRSESQNSTRQAV